MRDGVISKKNDARFPNTFNISLTVEADGVQAFKSSKSSIWPLQAIQNILPPQIRYLTENILLVGLHFGKIKPDRAKFFLPLIKEIKGIHAKGGFEMESLSVTLFLPIVDHCTCDLPAKAWFQGLTQYNGRFACGFCKHPGISFETQGIDGKRKKSSVYRYARLEPVATLRTHSNSISYLLKLEKKPDVPVVGFKKIPCMIGFPGFDVIHGFNLDYMHCVLLGNVSNIVGRWMDSKNWKSPFYIKKKSILDKRILSIRLPMAIARKPRTLEEKEFYKANEWRNLLLYCLEYCLDGLIHSRYIDHFHLLSAATYTLLKEKIHIDEVAQAKGMLEKFCDDFEELYGAQNVTMNMHLLRHSADTVVQSGPLWSQSMFAFEQANGELAKCIHGPTDVLKQITERYMAKKTLGTKNLPKQALALRAPIKRFIPSKQEKMLLSPYDATKLTYWRSVDVNGEKFTSLICKPTKSMDYFVQFTSGRMGKIRFYVKHNETVYALVENFITLRTKHHLIEVYSKKSISLYRVAEIKTKLIYMEINKKQIVCSIPNKYEKT